MSTAFGHLNGRLTLTVAGNEIDMGSVQIPVTGYQQGGAIRLTADTTTIRDAVQELFNQQKEQDT